MHTGKHKVLIRAAEKMNVCSESLSCLLLQEPTWIDPGTKKCCLTGEMLFATIIYRSAKDKSQIMERDEGGLSDVRA